MTLTFKDKGQGQRANSLKAPCLANIWFLGDDLTRTPA